jgi:enamine deaminase RidA (YjgF/YER057c/UK114 family)
MSSALVIAASGAALRVLGEKFHDSPPTDTTLICGVAAPGAKVEIEVTVLCSAV